MKFDNNTQAEKTMQLAIGRILSLGSREFKEGDIQDYENAKSAFLDAAEYLGLQTVFIDTNTYVYNYHKIHHY